MAIKKALFFILTCSTLLQVSFAFCQQKPRVEVIIAGENAGSISVVKLPDAFLWKTKNTHPRPDQWREMIGIFLKTELGPTPLPMLGKYTISDDSVIFNPRFPFLQGQTYQVRINMAYISIFTDQQLNDAYKDLITYDIKMPDRSYPSLEITGVYPTAEILPENLLRFYFYFSNPMKKGVLPHIRLFDDTGVELNNTFLDIGEELWSSNDKRLTLWLDPGRIKRDLTPNKSQGAPLVKNRHYVLRIDNKVEDVFGQHLAESIEKKFMVKEVDRIKPDIKTWKISIPKPLTKDPVIIYFGEPMDHSLVKNYLQVFNSDQVIEGEFVADNQETLVKFYPRSAWENSEYRLRVNGRLEDLAGNNLLRLFDSDLSKGEKPDKESEYLFRSFSVQ